VKRYFYYVIWFLLPLVVLGCSENNKSVLKVAAAANMQFALTEISEAFTQETGVEVEIILGSSGKLNAQIKAGAPFDVFVSADMDFPNDLFLSGFSEQAPKVYALGTLVIWTLDDLVPPSFNYLRNGDFNHIAVPNAKTAPYGRAVKEVLDRKKLTQELKSKLVYGESVGQTNQFIISKAAEIGITSKSVVMTETMRNNGTWKEIPANFHSPISQGIILIKNDRTLNNQAHDFYEFMFSAKANNILVKYGYRIP
jgi:molybdate transport system substrate-binding protein